MKSYDCELRNLISSTEWFMEVLRTVRFCDPPDWLVGGGVIRTLVWDLVHAYSTPAALRDIDVAYFDRTDLRPERDREIQNALCDQMPDIPWQAKNQAAVHLWYEQKFGFPVEPLIHE
ncbi:nucleotidyltransferase family protein [Alicyclobacillus mengziensis]|uniref:Nucleotidyltransferase family protein n=1 Tax=Alicyclobacillus mengziensis TaxID=2931921 RepID=A0A9X7VUZ7_9BACL|nr:nucleotidyltransferase family protein [Alicyclobacillus mengziensis]QSO45651.1 nucleotidyltransferase family protein [Alicyclobacillus mengziensis]